MMTDVLTAVGVLSGSERADLEGAAQGGPGRGLHHEELLARPPGPSSAT